MKKNFILLISLIFILCSCASQMREDYNSQGSDSNTSIISDTAESDDAILCSDDNYTSNDITDIELDIETNDNHTFDVIVGTTLASELPMYAQYGENMYVPQYVDGVLGTMRICNGNETMFFPNASNIYEKDGTVYGIFFEGESYMELTRHYCRFNEDGTFEKLFECWNVFYSDDKVYFYEYIPGKTENEDGITNICSANIDGSGKSVLSADIPTPYFTDRIVCYKDYLIYTANYDDIYVMSSDGTVFKAVDGSDASYEIEFVNNGFIYYTKRIGEDSGEIMSEETTSSLWRVGLDGEQREQLICVQTDSYYFDSAAFAEKLLLIDSDGIRVYSDSTSNCLIYKYKNFSFDKIVQISVSGDLLSVVGRKNESDNTSVLQTIVYDSLGNIVFNNQ